ncbi:MAG TPA: hypothetical protein VMV43_02600 [Candidatus Nanopelagicaceae bacterium]|jgi:hypothetical protein|nr:hypothetical protein [Candidatus Nanopelagicaceae bacterium]
MNQIQGLYKRKIDISSSHLDLLEKIFKKINLIIKGKREIMYSDIINLIARENYSGKLYNEIMLWCNYNIRQGKYFAIIQDLSC